MQEKVKYFLMYKNKMIDYHLMIDKPCHNVVCKLLSLQTQRHTICIKAA